jgi:transposase
MASMRESARSKATVYAAIELSKKSWVVAIARPDRDRPSIHRIAGGNLADLIGRLRKAAGEKQRIVVCYEAGYDGFGWRVRWQRSESTVASSIRQASKSTDGRAE